MTSVWNSNDAIDIQPCQFSLFWMKHSDIKLDGPFCRLTGTPGVLLSKSEAKAKETKYKGVTADLLYSTFH